ncbi:DsbA family oxidoreductase [Occultella kanbiaonis]|uniref:DsbA family oxidoreductase n=1 Tax=Occultella kanbiaonis TaxID=2675754 RepID=UPI0012B6F5AC|nr:DsbA family oxidoreductase [Occultella kanbiaonis]
MTKPTLTVDIWSDIACPWCYIGKRKFEEGRRAYDGQVEVRYHSFELAPDTPVDFEGSEVDFLATHKGMPAGQVQQMLDRVTAIAAEVGLSYDFDTLRHTNTLLAHQALHFAKANGKQHELLERLFAAYFEQGRHLGRAEELADLGADVGLDRAALLAALESQTYADDVQADLDRALALGISGVPFFVIDGKYGVSGAQSPETFTQVLEHVAADEAREGAGVE